MEDTTDAAPGNFVELTSDIVAAFVSHNSVHTTSLPELIASVHAALTGLGQPATEPTVEKKLSAAEIRKSIKRDGLVSFIDGKSYKTLKRHLTGHGLTPDTYRAKYGLPHDYPTVAASYAAQRSALAKSLGLGQVRQKQRAAAKAAQTAETKAQPSPTKKRGRRPKAAALSIGSVPEVNQRVRT